MPNSNLKLKVIQIYPPQNIITTVALGSTAGVTLVPPSENSIHWLSEEEHSAKEKRIRAENPWSRNYSGETFCFQGHDGSEFRAIFDRSYGFISEEEYNILSKKRSLKRDIYSDIAPTVLFAKVSTVCALKRADVPREKSTATQKYSTKTEAKNLKRKKFTIADLPTPNIITTIVLGNIAGISLALPDEDTMQWQSLSEKLHDRKIIWANENNQKTFCFDREDGSQFMAIFDKSCGFLAEKEYLHLQEMRLRRVKISISPTVLFSELSTVKGIGVPNTIPSSLPPRGTDPEIIRHPVRFQFPAGAASSLPTLFGKPKAPNSDAAEKMRLVTNAGERNSSALTNRVRSPST